MEEILEELREAVKIRLVSEVPLGAFLSRRRRFVGRRGAHGASSRPGR